MKTVTVTLSGGHRVTILTNAYNEADAQISSQIIDTPLIELEAYKNKLIKDAYAALPPHQKEPPIPSTAPLKGTYKLTVRTDDRNIRSIDIKKATKQINDTWVTLGTKDED